MANYLQGQDVFDTAEASATQFNSDDMIGWADKETKRIRILDERENVLGYAEHWMNQEDGTKKRFVCTSFAAGEYCEQCATGDKASKRIVANAVLLSPDGKKIEKQGFIRQGYGNFWNTLKIIDEQLGGLTKSDYSITRQGSGLDTKYTIIPIPAEKIEVPAKKNLAERFGIDNVTQPQVSTPSVDETTVQGLSDIITT